MPLKHFTNRHIVRLLATETRRTDTRPYDLCRSHIALGRYLAGELVEDLPLASCKIQHPQGIRSGWELEDEASLVLVVFMRAGLYAAEGFREVLPRARLVHVSPRRGVGLGESDWAELGAVSGQRFILIDSVVNTGASMEPVLGQLRNAGAAWIAVAALVTPESTAERLANSHPDTWFYFARTSTNQYTGKGSTDTGNRLFGTLPAVQKEGS